MKTFSIIIPTRNEAANLYKLLPVLIKLYPASPIWIVDDDSQDGTEKFIRQFSAKHPRVYLVSRKNQRGRGSAVLDGFRQAYRDKNITHFLEMDADLSHDPKDIEKLLDANNPNNKQPKIPILKTVLNASIDRSILGGDTAWNVQRKQYKAGVSEKFGIEAARIIIGSRHIPGARFINCSPIRVFLSHLANWYIGLILSIPKAVRHPRNKITDYTNGFRLYPRNAVEVLLSTPIREKGYITLSETAYILYKHGFNFLEVPTIFVNRKEGKSHATIFEFLRSLPAILRIRLNH